jgi:hypothetical protein
LDHGLKRVEHLVHADGIARLRHVSPLLLTVLDVPPETTLRKFFSALERQECLIWLVWACSAHCLDGGKLIFRMRSPAVQHPPVVRRLTRPLGRATRLS